MRAIQEFIKLLTGHSIQSIFAWIGGIFLGLTLLYGISIFVAKSESEKESSKNTYLGALNCFGVIIAVLTGLFLLIILLFLSDGLLEKIGLPRGTICYGPIALFIAGLLGYLIYIAVYRIRNRKNS